MSWALLVMANLGHSMRGSVLLVNSAKHSKFFWSVNYVLAVQSTVNVLLEQRKCEVVASFNF
jgi:hypothetical protein